MAQCKGFTCQCRRFAFHPWVGKIPWRRKWQLFPVFLAGKSHGQRRSAGYSSWGCKRVEHHWTQRQLRLGSAWWDWCSCELEETPESLLSLLLCHQREEEEVAVCKPERELSLEPNHAGPLILDFSLQNCEKINLGCLSHQVRHFVTVAQAKTSWEKTEHRRRRWQQRTRRLGSITDQTDVSLSKLWERGKDREAWRAAVHGVTKSLTLLSDWTTKS